MCLRCSPWPAGHDTSVGLSQVEPAHQDSASLHMLPSAILRGFCKIPGLEAVCFFKPRTQTHTSTWYCKPANLVFPWRCPRFTSLWISLPSDFCFSMEKAVTIQNALFYKENRVGATGNREGCVWNEEMCVFIQVQPLNKGKPLLVSGLASLSVQGAACMIVSKNLPTAFPSACLAICSWSPLIVIMAQCKACPAVPH